MSRDKGSISMIENKDSLEFLKTKQDYEFDIIYSDPPYALGSEVIIRPDGKVDYKKANDFMNKWEMPTGDYWNAWFKEAYRTLKHGGYCIMFGMDRQLLLFKYYAHLAGFEEQQSLYWYFISNFPKATDLSKMLDKNAGAERERVDVHLVGNDNSGIYGNFSGKIDDNNPITDIAKKYDGYKYSISPLKQTNETIMVFQKPYKTGSCLHDTLAYENGDDTCCCGALDIDGNRVPSGEKLTRELSQESRNSEVSLNASKLGAGSIDNIADDLGRYPSQTFVNSNTAEVLDKQGDVSKILHKCDYELGEYDIYQYQPKVSKSERNAGCDEFEEINFAYGGGANGVINKGLDEYNKSQTIGLQKIHKVKNNHPTLKPIKLNERILKLFKTPNEQKIIYPFAGSGSEIIGGIKAGFKNWVGCEINPDYVEIANARIKHWTNQEYQLTVYDYEGVEE